MTPATPRRRRLTGTVAAVVLVVAACAGDDDDGFEPGASIPGDTTTASDTATTSTADTAQPTTAVDDTTTTTSRAPATTTEPPSTAADTTAPTTAAPSTTDPEPQVADTPQAPGFDFPPAALQTDPTSPNNRRAIRPEHEPILAAYFAAFEADLATFSRWPLDPRSPELQAAPYTDSIYPSAYEAGMAERTALNQVLDISGGLTSRPYVVEDDDGDPNRVIVWDCQIDATFWKDVTTGEKAPPDAYPNVGPPGVETGSATELLLIDGEWLVNGGGVESRACE